MKKNPIVLTERRLRELRKMDAAEFEGELAAMQSDPIMKGPNIRVDGWQSGEGALAQ